MNSPFALLQIPALMAVLAAVYLVVFAAYAAPAVPTSRLGLRGYRRQVQIASDETWAHIEPIVRWLGPRMRFVLDDAKRAALEKKLALAGDWLGITPDELTAMQILSSVAGLGIGLAVNASTHIGAPVILGGLFVGGQFPSSRLAEAARERVKLIDRGLPHAIDLIALGMGAGLDFPGSIRQLVEKYGSGKNPIVDEFTLMLQGMALGHTRVRVLEQFAERVGSIAVKEFVSAVVQAEERGNPVVPALKIQAEVSRQRRTVRAEEAAAKAGVAMVGPLCLLFISILLLVIGPMALSLKNALANAPR